MTHTRGTLEVYGATMVIAKGPKEGDEYRVVCQVSEPHPESGYVGHNKLDIGSPNWGEGIANAERVVLTWNTHDELLEALEKVTRSFEHHPTCRYHKNPVSCDCAMADVKAAIAKAATE